MTLEETLQIIYDIALSNKIDKPYLVGGVPRDVYIKNNVKTTDIDITTNSSDILRLGILVADKLNAPFELADDGHLTVYTDGYDLDFSSNFESKEVLKILKNEDKKIIELYSRDFTLNTLLQDIKTKEIIDLTRRGFKDINDRIIRTPVPAKITLSDDPRRIYRAIELATRYNFSIDSDIENFAIKNIDLFFPPNVKERFIIIKINRAVRQNSELAIELLKKSGLFKKIPLSGYFKDYLINTRMLVDYLKD